MDKEEFYDSLEGDFSSPSNSSLTNQNSESKTDSNNQSNTTLPNSNKSLLIIKPPPENKLSSRRSSNSSLSSEFETKCGLYCNEENATRKFKKVDKDLSTVVPLYLGETTVYNINKARKCCSTSTLINKSPKVLYTQRSKDDGTDHEKVSPRKKRTRNRLVKNDSMQVQQVRSKSYLKIFHNRIGYPTSAKKKNITDTNRSLCGDTKRSSISSNSTEKEEYQDAEDNQFETASYYFEAIAESENPKVSDPMKSSPSSTTFYSSSSCFHIASVSEIFSDKETPKSKRSLRRHANSKLHPIPVLGGLGPDIIRNQNKMELRKKQMNYGQKASYKNRIKLLEMNILKNLKSEIEESNSTKNEVK